MAHNALNTAERIRRFFCDFDTSERDWEIPNSKKFNDFCLYALTELGVDTENLMRVQIGQSGNEELTPTINVMCAIRKCFNLTDVGILDFLRPNPKRTIAIIHRILDVLEFAEAEMGKLYDESEQFINLKKEISNLKKQIDLNNQKTNSIYLQLSKKEEKLSSLEEKLSQLGSTLKESHLEETDLQKQVLQCSAEKEDLSKTHSILKTKEAVVEAEIEALMGVAGEEECQQELERAQADTAAAHLERDTLWNKLHSKQDQLRQLHTLIPFYSNLHALASSTIEHYSSLRETNRELEKVRTAHTNMLTRIKQLEEQKLNSKSSQVVDALGKEMKEIQLETDKTLQKIESVTRSSQELEMKNTCFKEKKTEFEISLNESMCTLNNIISEHKRCDADFKSKENQIYEQVQKSLAEKEDILDSLMIMLDEAIKYKELIALEKQNNSDNGEVESPE